MTARRQVAYMDYYHLSLWDEVWDPVTMLLVTIYWHTISRTVHVQYTYWLKLVVVVLIHKTGMPTKDLLSHR